MQPLTVPATLDSLGPIGQYVLAAAAAAGLTTTRAYRLRGAVDEIATNAITHGATGAAAPGALYLRADLDPEKLTVTLEDTGVAFDPRQVPPPDDLHLPAAERKLTGLGIYLALQRVDAFAYERVGDRNRHTFIKKRSAPSAADR